MSSEHTLTYWLQHQAKTQPSAIALRHKRLGIWQQLSWSDVHHQVLRLANQLKSRHFGVGDTLYLLSYPRPEALLLSLAAQWLGGISAPLDPSYSREQITSLLQKLQPKFIFAAAEQQLEYIDNAGLAPDLVLYSESKGIAKFNFKHLVDVTSTVQANSILQPLEAVSTADFAAFRFYRLDINQAVEVKKLHHQTLIQEADHFIKQEHITAAEEALVARSFAASGHIRYLLAPWLLSGFKLNFPENIDTRDNDRRELGPSFVVGTATTYQRLYDLAQHRLPAPQSLRRKWIDYTFKNHDATFSPTAILSRWLIARSIKDVLGFSRIRVALIVGEPLSPEAEQFFNQLGIHIKNWHDYLAWQPLAQASRAERDLLSSHPVEQLA